MDKLGTPKVKEHVMVVIADDQVVTRFFVIPEGDLPPVEARVIDAFANGIGKIEKSQADDAANKLWALTTKRSFVAKAFTAENSLKQEAEELLSLAERWFKYEIKRDGGFLIGKHISRVVSASTCL